MKSLIEKIIAAPGPSGYEKQIRETIRAEVETFADDIRVDALGNLIVRKGPSAGSGQAKGKTGQRIMLAGHMDEIGIIVTHVDENGFARFSNIGGVYARYAPGGRVRFLDGTLGVINTERITDPHKVPGLEKMFIDLGATSKKDCPVKVGDVAVFERPFTDLGNRLVELAQH